MELGFDLSADEEVSSGNDPVCIQHILFFLLRIVKLNKWAFLSQLMYINMQINQSTVDQHASLLCLRDTDRGPGSRSRLGPPWA